MIRITNRVKMDASHIKVHPHATRARGGNQAISLTIGGSTPSHLWPWMRLVYCSEPLFRQVPAQISRRRCKIEALSAEHLWADKGYDSHAIVEQAIAQGMSAVIPPRKSIKSNEL